MNNNFKEIERNAPQLTVEQVAEDLSGLYSFDLEPYRVIYKLCITRTGEIVRCETAADEWFTHWLSFDEIGLEMPEEWPYIPYNEYPWQNPVMLELMKKVEKTQSMDNPAFRQLAETLTNWANHWLLSEAEGLPEVKHKPFGQLNEYKIGDCCYALDGWSDETGRFEKSRKFGCYDVYYSIKPIKRFERLNISKEEVELGLKEDYEKWIRYLETVDFDVQPSKV